MPMRVLVAYSASSTYVQTTLDYLDAIRRSTDYDVEYVHVTHGAISQQVRALERWLGAPSLFRRSTRRVVLTDSGAALLATVTTPLLLSMAKALPGLSVSA